MAGESAKRRKPRPKPKPDNPAQSKKFMEAARALGLENGKAFNEAMNTILKPKVKKGSGRS